MVAYVIILILFLFDFTIESKVHHNFVEKLLN